MAGEQVRRGRGRPRQLRERVKATITFEAADLAALKQLGAGNASVGVRRALADALAKRVDRVQGA